MNADELAAETKTDRIVRLALAAGRRQTELDQARMRLRRESINSLRREVDERWMTRRG